MCFRAGGGDKQPRDRAYISTVCVVGVANLFLVSMNEYKLLYALEISIFS